jgi:hypothetical protein
VKGTSCKNKYSRPKVLEYFSYTNFIDSFYSAEHQGKISKATLRPRKNTIVLFFVYLSGSIRLPTQTQDCFPVISFSRSHERDNHLVVFVCDNCYGLVNTNQWGA